MSVLLVYAWEQMSGLLWELSLVVWENADPFSVRVTQTPQASLKCALSLDSWKRSGVSCGLRLFFVALS